MWSRVRGMYGSGCGDGVAWRGTVSLGERSRRWLNAGVMLGSAGFMCPVEAMLVYCTRGPCMDFHIAAHSPHRGWLK